MSSKSSSLSSSLPSGWRTLHFFLGVSFSATLPYISLGLLLPFFSLPLRRLSCLTFACLISGSLSTKLHIDIIIANKEWHDHTSSCWLQVWAVDNIAKGTVTRFLFFLNLLFLPFNSLATERYVAICAANYTPRMVSSVFWHVSRWLNEPGKSLKRRSCIPEGEPELVEHTPPSGV